VTVSDRLRHCQTQCHTHTEWLTQSVSEWLTVTVSHWLNHEWATHSRRLRRLTQSLSEFTGSKKLCTLYPETMYPYSRNQVSIPSKPSLMCPSSKPCAQYHVSQIPWCSHVVYVLPSEIWQKSGIAPTMLKSYVKKWRWIPCFFSMRQHERDK